MFKLKHQAHTGNWIEPTYGEIVIVKGGIAKTSSPTTKRALELKGFREIKEEEEVKPKTRPKKRKKTTRAKK